ncbi:hypothetical protein L3X38_023670 [Prunus dulcis]|uniref:Uncharacterized protein n=1 Tax=Prunus dulcis TaxID=3755 RepID=A0AAD4VY98_PRUDU|nr:hypothetical protein L3X38_023670 [Prunus dulcis]
MVLSLIAAGKDTTASSLTWFIYMLCEHPHIQEKISQEVREATNLKDNSSIDELVDNLTDEALEKMQYLLAVLNETTRLAFFLTLPWATKISRPAMRRMGRMKYIYIWGDDAEEFRPERWLDENGLFQQESPFKFTAFSAGPRICVGKDGTVDCGAVYENPAPVTPNPKCWCESML